jgi:hypothetical protein
VSWTAVVRSETAKIGMPCQPALFSHHTRVGSEQQLSWALGSDTSTRISWLRHPVLRQVMANYRPNVQSLLPYDLQSP